MLRTHKLSDNDRIITMLTRHHGKVRAVAKGVRKTRSRFGSRLEPFTHVDLQLSTGRNLDIVTQAEMLSPHGSAIAADYARYTAGTVMLETADRLTSEEHEPATQQYLLLLNAVRALAGERYPADLVLDAYLLRAMAIGGFAPSLSHCARCGAPGPHPWFSVASGGLVCRTCRVPGRSPQPRRRLPCWPPFSRPTGRQRWRHRPRSAPRRTASSPLTSRGTLTGRCARCATSNESETERHPGSGRAARRHQ